MNNHLAGRLNGKQKAIGFIILFPMYLVIVPRFVNFGIYLLLKYTDITRDMNILGVYLNMICSLVSFIFAIYLLKDFIKDNIKRFKENFLDNILYSMTIGIVLMYVVSIVANLLINLILGGSSNDSANQLLFETYMKKNAILMIIQSVILAPVLEELLFRGLIFRSLRDRGKVFAFALSSFLFGFLHIYSALFAGDLTQLVYLLSYGGMGFVLTYAYEVKGNVCVPILIHMLNNLIAVLVLIFV